MPMTPVDLSIRVSLAPRSYWALRKLVARLAPLAVQRAGNGPQNRVPVQRRRICGRFVPSPRLAPPRLR